MSGSKRSAEKADLSKSQRSRPAQAPRVEINPNRISLDAAPDLTRSGTVTMHRPRAVEVSVTAAMLLLLVHCTCLKLVAGAIALGRQDWLLCQHQEDILAYIESG